MRADGSNEAALVGGFSVDDWVETVVDAVDGVGDDSCNGCGVGGAIADTRAPATVAECNAIALHVGAAAVDVAVVARPAGCIVGAGVVTARGVSRVGGATRAPRR